VSRKKIEAAIWLNNFPPKELCERNPELHQYGFYRKLNNGKLEFVSICKEEAKKYLTMYKDDLDEIMQEAFGTSKKAAKRIKQHTRIPDELTESVNVLQIGK
jgi:acid phosphatase class B